MKSKIYIFAAILILTAVFTGCNKETYTVTFNPNGGTGTMQPQTFTEGEAQVLNRNAFTYDGYTFTGWNTVQSGSGISYPDGQTITATMDMTLYAQWTSNGTSGGGQQGGETPTPTPPNPAGSPTVETGSTRFTGASLIFSGNVTAAGDAPVTARGFMYGTSASNLSNSVECGAGTGYFTTEAIAVDLYTTYYYKAYATNSVGTAYGDIMSFTTTPTTGTLNGHDWVDLGLPSGTKWAKCNVGASSPTAKGNYYAWGETTTKSTYNWSTYRWCNGNDNTFTKYCANPNYGYNGFTDTLRTLEASDDAATANWGTNWRMPTGTEMHELINNCTHIWTTQNGVNGCLFTGPNGNSIFLPAAGGSGYGYWFDGDGVYWTSNLTSYDSYKYPGYLEFNNNSFSTYTGCPRYCGYSVRPIVAQ